MFPRFLPAAALAVLTLSAALPTLAALGKVTPSGYVVTIEAPIRARPLAAFTALQQVGKWWSDEHTYSGNARHMTLAGQAGGCFCERWNHNSIEHARVLYVDADKLALRLQGGLGPLQAMAVNGIMDFRIKARGDDASLTFTYRVRGTADDGLDKTAAAVDRVLSEQVARLVLFAETGSPVPLPPQEPLKDQFFSSNGVDIRYVEGAPGADPVILLHDRGSSIEEQWIDTRIMPVVHQELFRVIAMDLRGHGKSGKARLDAEAARDVVRLLDHLKIPRAHIVGYGLGANIAAYLAVNHADRLITVVLAGGAHVPPTAQDDRRELAVTDEQLKAVTVPALGLVGTKDPALRELVQLKARMPRLVRMVSLQDETHASAPRNPGFVPAIQYFLRYHPPQLVN